MSKRTPAPRDTRDRILAAALTVFAGRGFHEASIDEVAAGAGVTKGAVYYWFTDKDDLARDLSHSIWERLKADALAAFDPAGDTVENLLRCFDAYLSSLQGLPEARFFLRDVWTLSTDDAERSEALSLFRDVLDAGVERGHVEPLDTGALASVLVGAFSEATIHILTTGEAGPTRDVVARLLTALSATKAAER